MKQWAAGRAGGSEAVQAEKFHWGQVTSGWVLPVVEPWHEKLSQITGKVGKKGQRSAKDSQREVFVMWSFERLEWSTAWEWGIEIAKKLYPATFSPNVFVEHVFSFIFVTEWDHISESPDSAIYFS